MNKCQDIFETIYPNLVLCLSLTDKRLDSVQYFYMFTKNERQIRIVKPYSNRQELRNLRHKRLNYKGLKMMGNHLEPRD